MALGDQETSPGMVLLQEGTTQSSTLGALLTKFESETGMISMRGNQPDRVPGRIGLPRAGS
jgi:hypothetical protein